MLKKPETVDRPASDAGHPRSSTIWNSSAVIFGVIAVLFGLGLCFSICGSNDLFWQLRTGREIVLNHAVPHFDTYSYTHYRTPWVVHEWLTFIAMWEAYHAGGYFGVWFLQAVMTLIICAALYIVVYRETGGAPLTALMATVFGEVLAATFFQPRPQLSTYVGVILVTGAILSARRARPTRVYWLLPFFLLWSNLHAGVVIGIGLLGLFTLCDFAELRLRKDLTADDRTARTAALPHLAATAALAGLLSLVTPYGPHVYANFAATISNNTMLNLLGEWQPADFHTGFGKLLEAYMAMLLAAMFASRQRKDAAEIVLLAGLVHEALMYNRNVPLLAFIGTIIVSRHLQSAIQRLVWRGSDEEFWTGSALFGRKVGLLPTIAVAVALLGLTAMRDAEVARQPDSMPTHGLNRIGRVLLALRTYPERGSAFLHREPFPASTRLYNIYGEGGYLIWTLPEHKVFIDGRADVYFGKMLDEYAALRKLPFSWEQTLDEHQVNVIMTSTAEKQSTLFLSSPQWAAVYVDDPNLGAEDDATPNSIILIKRGAGLDDLIRRCRTDCPAYGKAAARYPDFIAFQ